MLHQISRKLSLGPTDVEHVSIAQAIYDSGGNYNTHSISVVFRESVRKNARYCFEKKGFA